MAGWLLPGESSSGGTGLRSMRAASQAHRGSRLPRSIRGAGAIGVSMRIPPNEAAIRLGGPRASERWRPEKIPRVSPSQTTSPLASHLPGGNESRVLRLHLTFLDDGD